MSQLGVILQESVGSEREARTILGLLTEGGQRRRRTLKERLRFSGIPCCGAAWPFRSAQQAQVEDPGRNSGMNLAAALAAERQYREEEEGEARKVSLMRLLEETERAEKGGSDWVCCVCMGRNKGAAFIPCGHTFCRVCSRELWLNRGTCPLCNRSILDILNIF